MYWVKTPGWLKKIYSQLIWDMPKNQQQVYLTFDDGPHPTITPWVLEQLKLVNAHATFFCIGKNVQAHPEIYQQIIEAGHQVGNHTYNHINGWKSGAEIYKSEVLLTQKLVNTELFRPPYGRISFKQIRLLKQHNFKIIMWDVLSGDFDTTITADQCKSNVLRKIQPGSIVVFHDSDKAWPRLKTALPDILQELNSRGFQWGRL